MAAIGRVQQRTSVSLPLWVNTAARVTSDALLVVLGFWLAYHLRYSLHLGGEVTNISQQRFAFFEGKILLLMVLTIVLLQIRGLYRLPRWTPLLDELSGVASAVTTAMALVILYSFLQRFYPSRLIFIYAWLLIIVLLALKRVGQRIVREQLWERGIGVDTVLVVGSGRAGQRMMQWLFGQPQLGYRVAGFVDDTQPEEALAIATQRRVERPTYLGTTRDVPELVRRMGIDEVIIALPATQHEQMLWILDQCRAESISFKLVPDLFELSLDRVDVHAVGGLPLIGLKSARIAGWNYAIKRSLDVVASLVVLIGLSWLIALVALAIRLESKGPVLFRQERVGKDGERFVCFKFRTMVQGAQEQEHVMRQDYIGDQRLAKFDNDPRRTKVGTLLRNTSIDELPQFLNILLGDMSVVGPRPQVPWEVEKYEDWHHARLTVTPGITGLWQVSGRSRLSFEEMVRLDLYYAEHWSLWLDLKIILRPLPAVATARGAQ